MRINCAKAGRVIANGFALRYEIARVKGKIRSEE